MGETGFANDTEMEIDSVSVPENTAAAAITETPAAIAEPTTTTSTNITAEPTPTTTTESTTITASTASTEPVAPPRPLGPDGNPISKSAYKKQLKLQRLAETREQWKADKRRKLKERKQRNREEREAAATTGSKRKADDASDEEQQQQQEEEEEDKDGKQEGEPAGKKQKQAAGVKRVVEDITLILDCGFDEKMHEKEVVSMSSQLTRCYAFNRAAPRQFKLAVTSLNGRLLARFQTGLNNQHLHWKGVTFSDAEYEVNDETRGKLVYLTADAEDTVEELEPGTSYIIGGIVDRNRYKNLCYNKAVAQGIRTAKLPIGDYIKMASRFVLTTNQVVEIMLKYLECRDWKEAFITVIPPRKQPAVKAKEQEGAEGKEGAADDETENCEVEGEGN